MQSGATRRNGFTLIEMLVVIAIISILVSLVVTTSGLIRQRAQVAAVNTLIQGLSSALNRYNVEFGEYPPSSGDDLGDAPIKDSLYRFLCGENGEGLIKVVGANGANAIKQRIEPFVDVPKEYLVRDGATTIIVDAWGTPIVYLNCQAYTQRMQANNPGYTDDGKCHNGSSFDIYSCGPNKVKDPDPLNPIDDITNWAAVR
ncbi:MAG: prepilin-type N-terminal cleavage/methylation domain-containing protein [Planctomycetota bacterium]